MIRRSLPVRFLLMILSGFMVAALPEPREARRILGSESFEEREALTLTFWNAGPSAIPLLTLLASDDEPEVARRALFVLKRVRMGLAPGAPDDLLLLAEMADQADFESRSGELVNLIEHPDGFKVALAFLDQWISEPLAPHEHRVSLAEVFIESLVPQRKSWRIFLKSGLSPITRAYLISLLCIQDLPARDSMIAILASSDLREIHGILLEQFAQLPDETHLLLARLATIRQDLSLATSTLSHRLTQSDSADLARNLAFLEKAAGLPPVPVEGQWRRSVEVLRARAGDQTGLIEKRARLLTDQPLLHYESLLLAGKPILPEDDQLSLFNAPDAIPVWHLAFGPDPEEPDIEALTSSLLIDWPDLARTLTALARPVEAAEKMSSENQIESALNLLWRTGRKDEALELALNLIKNGNKDDEVAIRLAVTSLLIESNDRQGASDFFRPLFMDGIENDTLRRIAIPLALPLFPLEQVTALEPGLRADRSFRRQRAIPPFLDLPPQVSGFWYEYFRKQEPEATPADLIRNVRNHLENNPVEARRILDEHVTESTKVRLLPSDPLYQNALFLQLPVSLDLVIKAAWYELSTRDLESIVQSEDWPLEERKRALIEALQINPLDPVLRWFDYQFNGGLDPDIITQSTLGDPLQILRLASVTGLRETLTLASRVSNFKDSNTLRCLALLGRSHLANGEPALAARLLFAAHCGEMATGPSPPPFGIKTSLQNLGDLHQARLRLARSPKEKDLWQERLFRLGHD